MNSFIKLTEEITGSENNQYIIYGGSQFQKTTEPKFVKDKSVVVALYDSKKFYDAIGDLKQYRRIFFHFLSNEMCDFILKNRALSAKFYWAFWGADLYTPFTLFKKEIYDELSIDYFNKHDSFVSTGNKYLDALKKLKRKFSSDNSYRNQLDKRKMAIKRIDYFLHYNSADYELLQRLFDTKAQHLPFFYYDYDYSKLNEINDEGRNAIQSKFNFGNSTVIQLGHSASLSNNHFSLFEQITYLKNQNFSFICPLSYGDKNYATAVIKKGKEIFGEKFIPLTEYLRKEDYAALLNRIDISFMNHIRTEAAGNTFMMLAMGKKVFLNSKSNLYKFLLNEDVKVFSLNDDLPNIEYKLTHSLINEVFIENQNIISDYFSEIRALNHLRCIYSK